MTISSYVSIFDDWDLLKPSLWSIEDIADEIVIVDGAYEWMEPYLNTDARDPTKSADEMYDIISSFGKKIRVVNGLWKNETHKRQAGYEACNGSIILRNDADEIFFMNESTLNEFLNSPYAVGQMEMPIYVYPGHIRAVSETSTIERQSFLFDRNSISAKQHLSYLWLVLPEDERATLDPYNMGTIFPSPIAFTAHLTHWRGPSTAVNRARFYVMNYIRSAGTLPWVRGFTYRDGSSFEELAKLIPPKIFREVLLGDAIVSAPPQLENYKIRSSGQSKRSERVFDILYDNMLQGLVRLNDDLAEHQRAIANGVRYCIDATTNRSTSKIGKNGTFVIECSDDIVAANVRLSILDFSGKFHTVQISSEFDRRQLCFDIPSISGGPSLFLRRTIELTINFEPNLFYSYFRASR